MNWKRKFGNMALLGSQLWTEYVPSLLPEVRNNASKIGVRHSFCMKSIGGKLIGVSVITVQRCLHPSSATSKLIISLETVIRDACTTSYKSLRIAGKSSSLGQHIEVTSCCKFRCGHSTHGLDGIERSIVATIVRRNLQWPTPDNSLHHFCIGGASQSCWRILRTRL